MNLVLLEPGEAAQSVVHLDARRSDHIRRVLRAGSGQQVRVGVIGGAIGRATVLVNDVGVELAALELDEQPPRALSVTLVLALPRPPMLRRILQHVSAMGVKHIVLIHTARVEKSYWSSSAMRGDAIRRECLLGLEQAVDTILPVIETKPHFLPFVEDELPSWRKHGSLLLAELVASRPCASQSGHTSLVIGPEGGFVAFERERLEVAGCQPVSLGQRVLRVETAVVAALARLSGP